MEENTLFPPDSNLDLSFTSCATTTSSARSSLTLSFTDSTTITTSHHHRPHRKSDPHWYAIKTATALSTDNTLHLSHLKLFRRLGSGNLGRVFLCRLRHDDHSNFALKVVDKTSLTPKKFSQIKTEVRILYELDHPFLPTLYTHFEDSHYTCLLIDYCPNGDLHSLLSKQPGNRLPVKPVRFFAAEVLVALEYLHALGVIYRDLKPENILLRENGHIMLSDFDLCFKSNVVPHLENRAHYPRRGNCFGYRVPEQQVTEFVAEPTTAFSRSCVGTHEYLAPEMVTGNGHGNGVDWWAFGVLLYEMLSGTTPFKGGCKEDTMRNIASSRGARFVERESEEEGMSEAKDLIVRLLVKDPSRRLGCARGATDIKRHPFFDGVKWPLILGYRPPELRGLVVKKAKGQHVGHPTGMTSPKRRVWWWKRTKKVYEEK